MKTIWTLTRPLYPGESILDDDHEEIAERKKMVLMKRHWSANYRQRVKADNEALNMKRETETLAAAQGRCTSLYFSNINFFALRSLGMYK